MHGLPEAELFKEESDEDEMEPINAASFLDEDNIETAVDGK